VGNDRKVVKVDIKKVRGTAAEPAFDVLWVHGYATINAMHGMMAAKALGIPVLLRAESWLRDRGRSGPKLAMKKMFFAGLQRMVDAVLPIGSLNAEYWHHYFGDSVPQFLMPPHLLLNQSTHQFLSLNSTSQSPIPLDNTLSWKDGIRHFQRPRLTRHVSNQFGIVVDRL
jgi:hypothetical protein